VSYLIKVNNVSKKFDKKIILNNYSRVFEDNKIYSIIGRSGCGKTTLLRIIAGLIEPDTGSVTYNDGKIDKKMPEIFMMHQHYTNFPWKTCLENVLFPIELKSKVTKEHEMQAVELLKQVGLGENINMYPYELSGGMKQRLSLARILMTKPPVILMDEPMSALDDKTRVKMQDYILELHAETKNTIIMVTHDVDEARKMGDEIINL
jgi:NitT/TauT family transport system ATP-binding protein